MSKKQSVISCIILFAVTFAVSGLSALLTHDSVQLYPSFTKPPFAPPAIVFPIVWSILFALMSISAWLILRSLTQLFTVKGALCSPSMLLYFAQLIVNFFWSILFFRFRLYLPAFFWLLLLVFLVTKMILSFCMLVYMLSFFTISPQGWRMVLTGAVEFLSGNIIPLPFFPEKYVALIKCTPFAYMQNVPFRIYSGDLGGGEVYRCIAGQFFWLAALILLGRCTWKAAEKRVVIQGG